MDAVQAIGRIPWAQCDNPNCNKWRRLPLGMVVDESAEWWRLHACSLLAGFEPEESWAAGWLEYVDGGGHSSEVCLRFAGIVS